MENVEADTIQQFVEIELMICGIDLMIVESIEFQIAELMMLLVIGRMFCSILKCDSIV